MGGPPSRWFISRQSTLGPGVVELVLVGLGRQAGFPESSTVQPEEMASHTWTPRDPRGRAAKW